MKLTKKVIALLLAVMMVFGTMTTAFAAEDTMLQSITLKNQDGVMVTFDLVTMMLNPDLFALYQQWLNDATDGDAGGIYLTDGEGNSIQYSPTGGNVLDQLADEDAKVPEGTLDTAYKATGVSGGELVVKDTATGKEGTIDENGDIVPVVPVPVDKTVLETAISAAKSLRDSIPVDTDAANVLEGTYWVLQEAVDTFNTAISAAEVVLADDDATRAQVEAAVTALNTAAAAFNGAKQDGAKTAVVSDLTDLIAAATALKTAYEISDDGNAVPVADKWVTQDDVDGLETAIEAAEAVADGTDTETTIAQAIAALNAAMTEFNNAAQQGTLVDTTAYDAIVADVGALVETDYTQDSWALYEAAIEECDLTLTAEDGQEALDAEVIKIQAAIDLLEDADDGGDETDGVVIESVRVTTTTKVVVVLNEALAGLTTADFTVERALKNTPTAFSPITASGAAVGTGNVIYTLTIPTIADGDIIKVTARGTNLGASSQSDAYIAAFAVGSIGTITSTKIPLTLSDPLAASVSAADAENFTVIVTQTKPTAANIILPVTGVEGISGSTAVNLIVDLTDIEASAIEVNGQTSGSAAFDFLAPVISGASAFRTSEMLGSIRLTAHEVGTYKMLVDPTGTAPAPTTEEELTGPGGSLTGSSQNISILGLTSGVAAKVYIMFLDNNTPNNKSDIVEYTISGAVQAQAAVRTFSAGTAYGTIKTSSATNPAYVIISDTEPELPEAGAAMPTTGGVVVAAGTALPETPAVVGQWAAIYEAQGTTEPNSGKIGAFTKIPLTSGSFAAVHTPALSPSNDTARVKQGSTIAINGITAVQLAGCKLYAQDRNVPVFNSAIAKELQYFATATIATLPDVIPEGTYKLHLVHTASGTSTASTNFFTVDNTPPVIREVSVLRTSDTNAVVTFVSDESAASASGVGHFGTLAASATAVESIVATGSGGTVTANTPVVVTYTGSGNAASIAGSLSAGAMVLSVIVVDAAGNTSNKLDIQIPAYIQGVVGQSQAYVVQANNGENTTPVSGASKIKLLSDGTISFEKNSGGTPQIALPGSTNFDNIKAVLTHLKENDTITIATTTNEIIAVNFVAVRSAPVAIPLGTHIKSNATITSSGAHTAKLTITGTTSGAITVSAFGSSGSPFVDVSDKNLTGAVTVSASSQSGAIAAGTKALSLTAGAGTSVHSAGRLTIGGSATGANQIPAGATVELTGNSSIAENGVLTVAGTATLVLKGGTFTNEGKLTNAGNLYIQSGAVLTTTTLDIDSSVANGELLSESPYDTATRSGGTIVYAGGKLVVGSNDLVIGQGGINPIGDGYVSVRTRDSAGVFIRTEGTVNLEKNLTMAVAGGTDVTALGIRGGSVLTVLDGITFTTADSTVTNVDGILSIASGGALVCGSGAANAGQLQASVNGVEMTLRLAPGAKVTSGVTGGRLVDRGTDVTETSEVTVGLANDAPAATAISAGDYVTLVAGYTGIFTKS